MPSHPPDGHPPQHAAQAAGIAPELAGQGILIVDDEAGLLTIAELTLRSYGFEAVHAAQDGEVALETLRTHDIGAIMMDLTMPGLSGSDLLRQFVAAKPEVPVVVVTAIHRLETAIECMQLGAVNYLVKPVRSDDLIRAAHNALEMRKLRGQNAELECVSHKMQGLGRLATGIVHDFNNLMHIVSASCEVAELKRYDPETVSKYLVRAKKATEAASNSAQRLLTFAKGGPHVRQVVDLSQVVGEFVAFFAPLARSQVQVETTDVPLPVELYKDDLLQALLNLSLNAQDGMPHGGTLTLRVRAVEPDSRPHGVEVIACPRDRYLGVLEVCDTGHGMDPEQLGRMLAPFATTKPDGRGLGIGLTIVRDVIRHCAGALEVETKPGIGSAFRMLFPLVSAPEPPTGQGPRRDRQERGGSA